MSIREKVEEIKKIIDKLEKQTESFIDDSCPEEYKTTVHKSINQYRKDLIELEEYIREKAESFAEGVTDEEKDKEENQDASWENYQTR
jgi:hypothetical protein